MNVSNSYESDEYSGDMGRFRKCLQKHLGVSRQDLILLRANSYSSGGLLSWLLVKTDEIFYFDKNKIKGNDWNNSVALEEEIKKQVLLWKFEKLGL